MSKAKQKPKGMWPYMVVLSLLFVLSIGLRATEIVGPITSQIAAKPLSQDAEDRLIAIQQNFNSLAQAPREQIKLGVINAPSMQYLVLIDAGDRQDEIALNEQLTKLESIMANVRLAQAPQPTATTPSELTVTVPILMYHRTQPNFEQQIQSLKAKGYTSITLAELRSSLLARTPLPARPVIITLDDGYSDQLQSVAILKKYNMKATLYMINGGAGSNWCIGANAKGLPGCESYLTWDQIRALDREGLITIGAHTINHPNLASLSAEQQRTEIIGGKQELERQLGKPVTDFAYPYGLYNATSVQIVQEAGFLTAVTTQPGVTHTAASLFTLTRVRDALLLP